MSRDRIGPLLVTLLLGLVFAYAFLALFLYLGQDRFLFPAPKGSRGPVAGFETIAYRTSDGITLTGAWRPPKDTKPVLVFFHGNAADWQSGAVALDGLADAGYGAFAAGYRGYGTHLGKPSEAGLYRDGRAALAWLIAQGIGSDRLVLIGNSLGGGVATQLASETEVRGLALISTFSSMPDIVAERVWWLPTDPLLRHRFDNAAKLGGIDAEILLVHGAMDRVIPATHSQRLARIRADSRLVIVEGAGHDLAYQEPAEAVLADWLKKL